MYFRLFILFSLIFIFIFSAIIAQEESEEWFYAYEDEIDTLIDKFEDISEVTSHDVQGASSINMKMDRTSNHKPFEHMKKNREVKVKELLSNFDYVNTTSTLYGCMTEDMFASARLDMNSAAQNTTASTPEVEASSSAAAVPKKRLSAKEIQEEKSKQQAEVIVKKERIKPTYRLGGSCESLVCESCNILIAELATNIAKAASNESITTIDEVLNSFCTLRDITTKYTSLVSRVCNNMTSVVSCVPYSVVVLMVPDRLYHLAGHGIS
jgi:hypothetical protein